MNRIPPKPDLLCTDVDYKGVVYGTQLAIHFMRKNIVPGGKIVATASVAGIVPHESYPEYDGAKAAVVNFVRATARILKNVRSEEFRCGCELTVCRRKILQSMPYAPVRPISLLETTAHEADVHRYRPYVNHTSGNGRCRVSRLVGHILFV
tara:strand:+ start:38830 stop:39282 length:453 start_codon:yes stop_codon:yes gene_type:complete